MNSLNLASIVLLLSSVLCQIDLAIAFLGSLLKDIKSERLKITEKDNLRLLFVTKWCLEFFLAVLVSDNSANSSGGWGFELVTEVVDRGWIVWILRRMRGAIEEKVGQCFRGDSRH